MAWMPPANFGASSAPIKPEASAERTDRSEVARESEKEEGIGMAGLSIRVGGAICRDGRPMEEESSKRVRLWESCATVKLLRGKRVVVGIDMRGVDAE